MDFELLEGVKNQSVFSMPLDKPGIQTDLDGIIDKTRELLNKYHPISYQIVDGEDKLTLGKEAGMQFISYLKERRTEIKHNSKKPLTLNTVADVRLLLETQRLKRTVKELETSHLSAIVALENHQKEVKKEFGIAVTVKVFAKLLAPLAAYLIITKGCL